VKHCQNPFVPLNIIFVLMHIESHCTWRHWDVQVQNFRTIPAYLFFVLMKAVMPFWQLDYSVVLIRCCLPKVLLNKKQRESDWDLQSWHV
jgi:hypothetical protein